MGEPTEYEPGAFCWVGLATSDPVGAKAFYARLFGWTSDEPAAGDPGAYTILRRNGREVAILYRQTAEARAAGAPPHWTSFVSVADADATAARAGKLGGAAVFREPFDVRGEGRVAAIRDPSGAMLSLWQPRARAGAALVNDVGAFCWNELVTPDVNRCRSFYGDLFGWRYRSGDGDTIIENAGRLVGSMREPTGQDRGVSPDWLPYLGVEHADDAARRAEQSGGHRVTPTSEAPIGRFAVLADPQGAVFAVREGA
jgi:uncharacterized protein